ncbi:MAG: hypothetical protein ABH803_01450 [Candidatus Micrarchaeota archaeon]
MALILLNPARERNQYPNIKKAVAHLLENGHEMEVFEIHTAITGLNLTKVKKALFALHGTSKTKIITQPGTYRNVILVALPKIEKRTDIAEAIFYLARAKL